ncbi:hypothetical protein A2631_00125 [Candidatus Daviesbacteria bacterium RIFCSPHIGHO2_01_FULL_44_29]|nr:MAG: hypothetical protein A2631_00125 [Candidatus Daviesbacteria bacterium RIFCSPHIGHO2_01_FULL_44_29]OGE40924.1 MAG: hypothetical protein A3E86_05550 [Candidatus Daviesbacteria bacterium RIFCSPHIGHO2_12_FULL_47_45]OGE70118.1 MAG: hypothetical protein A3B55_00140 [Candidatus Daviesbacteria bacterium RIFCSPLOWO2_01_FULL_43_15]
MSIFPHTVAGAVAGSFFDNPIAGGMAGFVSHLLMDMVPHWEPDIYDKKNRERKVLMGILLLIDLSLGILVLIFVSPNPAAFWGGLVGAATDADNFLQMKFKSFPLLSKIGIKTHDYENHGRWHGQISNPVLGMIGPVIVAFGGLFYLFLKLH